MKPDSLPSFWEAYVGLGQNIKTSARSDAKMDTISGLVALGYKPQEASRHVQSLDTEGLSSEAIIRAVLRGQLQG